MSAETTPILAPRPLSRNRTYIAVLIGHVISVLGDTFHSLALAFWVLQTTGSGTAMATVVAVKTVVSVLLGPIAGTVADRVDRRRLMISMDLARFVLVAIMVFLVRLPAAPFAIIIVTTALIAACNSFMNPAFSASLIQIAGREQLGQAQASLQTFTTIASIVGPSIGGAVFAMKGASFAFGADALSYLISAVLILAGGFFPSPRKQGDGARSSFWTDMREGLLAVRDKPLVRGLMVTAPAINFFGNAAGTALAILVIKEWLTSPALVGLMEGATPVGLMVGGVFLMAFIRRLRHRGLVMGAGVLLIGLSTIPIPLVGFWPMLPLLAVSGLAMAVTNGLLGNLMARETPPELQGRVFGLLTAAAMAVAPIGTLLAGGLADAIGAGPIIILAGAGVTALGLIGWTIFPALRQYD